MKMKLETCKNYNLTDALFFLHGRNQLQRIRDSRRMKEDEQKSLTNYWLLSCNPSCSVFCHTFQELKRCFLKINKSHEPKFVPINGDNLNILLWCICTHVHWVDTANTGQRYHNLFQKHVMLTTERLLKFAKIEVDLVACNYLVVAPSFLSRWSSER